ncbi:MAG: imelysin family protein [Bacteroidales bacterium]|nr:imelysin family protein [Bacteroidales bacterium]
MKKISMLGWALMAAVAFTASSCSSDDDNNENNGGNSEAYSDKSYGQNAISACNELVSGLEGANAVIASASLNAEQEAYLKDVVSNLVDNVIVPTYTELADETEQLEATLNGLDVNSISQKDVDKACDLFKKARKTWEQSEAFLGGAASDFDVDPTIDSWPLNRSLLLNYFSSGTMDEDMLDDASILGFHALEFILFRNGQPRNVSEFKSNDTYKGFTSVSGAKELLYAQQVCKLLKERTFQLQVAWEGETAKNADRVQVVKNADLEYVTSKGISFGENMKKAGETASTFSSLKDAIAQILSDDEGSAAAIANEVGTAKIANPFSAGYIFYVESPYSYNSITDFQDNIRSIRNVWYGSRSGSADGKNFYDFFVKTNKSATSSNIVTLFNDAINKIGNIPAPFVKYCSTIWNLPYENDDRTADDLPEEE